MDIKDFDNFMKSITHSSMGGKNNCKNLDKNGRVLQNCVALVDAYMICMTGKELCVGYPKQFPVNSQTPENGGLAIWEDHVAIVFDKSKFECLSSADNGYFYKHKTYPNWQRSGGKLRGFYNFKTNSNTTNKTSSHDLDAIALDVYRGKYGNEPVRSEKLKALGLSDSERKQVQDKVDAMYKKK